MSGFQVIAENGVIQFDSDWPQYGLVRIVRGQDCFKPYPASNEHVVVLFNVSGEQYNVTVGLSSIRAIGNGMFEAGAYGAWGGQTPNSDPNKWGMLIFEPYSYLFPHGPTPHHVGLEIYNEAGAVVYSTVYPNLNVLHVQDVPEPSYNGQAFYGNPSRPYNYTFDTGIAVTDKSNYGFMFAQHRLGVEHDFDGDQEVDWYVERAYSTIVNGQLQVTLDAMEVGSEDSFYSYWASLTWLTYGLQQCYVVDLTNIRHLL